MKLTVFNLIVFLFSASSYAESEVRCRALEAEYSGNLSDFIELAESMQVEDECSVEPVDRIIIGDSQNGATWATSYFGNFFQRCLSQQNETFKSIARGGSTPMHWVNNSGNDRIDTIMRDKAHNHQLIKTSELPVCQRRLKEMIAAYQAKKVFIALGDNIMGSTSATAKVQFSKLLESVQANNIAPENCVILTPTYEMQTTTRRSVAIKTLENTKRIIEGIKSAAAGKCRVIDGTEVMAQSEFFIPSQKILKRINVTGTGGCTGANQNDNIHVCGKAAQDYANRVCDLLE